MPSAVGTSSSFSIQELTGPDLRLVVLQGRGLPYRPFKLSTNQRVELEWLPGSPEATSTVLSSKEDPATLNGYWKDKFIGVSGQDDSAGQGPPPILSQGVGIPPVIDASRLFDSLCRYGQLLEVTWLSTKRH